ncbi:hypothetical protein IWX90DRAFT_416073 [Phyllosticta citrichinensis]|uniref:Uncharacterized protein n=1 Tax=Phyllosticta citrichinensis TaxID=1130410 RepID=A0ABR1XRJ1_9PEZI
MVRVKSFSSKAKARLSSLSKALLRRKPKASTTVVSTTASNEESHDSSPEHFQHAKVQPTSDGNLLSSEPSNIETSGLEEDRPQYRQLPSFGSLSGAMISSSSQFDLPAPADTSFAMLETDAHHTGSSSATFEMENSANASSEAHRNHELSSTANLDSENAADASSEIYHHHEISSATEFDSEDYDTESHATKPDAPKIRIPMVERSKMCLFTRSSNSSNSISMGNEDATVDDDEEDGRYYGFCRDYDFSDSLVILEEANVRVGDVEEAEDVDEEFVKAWRVRHGYDD